MCAEFHVPRRILKGMHVSVSVPDSCMLLNRVQQEKEKTWGNNRGLYSNISEGCYYWTFIKIILNRFLKSFSFIVARALRRVALETTETH